MWCLIADSHIFVCFYVMYVHRLGGRARVTLGDERQYYEYLPDILTNYGRCIECGYRHLQQCLPRIITLYCDWGAEQHKKGGRATTVKERQATTAVVNVMKSLAKNIPPVAWLVTLSQLISRICHPYHEVSEVLQSVLCRCLEAFPQQTLWAIACLLESSSSIRRTVANGLIKQVRGHIQLSKTMFEVLFKNQSIQKFYLIMRLCVLDTT